MKNLTTFAIALAMVASTGAIARPNPASVFCAQTLGGKLVPNGDDKNDLLCQVTDSSGTKYTAKEWDLFRLFAKVADKK